MIAKIIEIGAVENMRIALGVSDVLKLGIERCFAVKAAVSWVCPIVGLAQLVGYDDLMCDTPVLAEPLG